MVFWIFFKVTCLLWVGRRKVKCMGLGSNLKKVWLPQSPKTAPYKGTESPLFHSVKNLKAGLWPSLTITSVGGGDTSRGWERETFTSRRRGTETLLRGSLWLSCYYWSAECWTFLNLAFMSRQIFFWICMLFGNLQPTSNKNHEMADTENLCSARRLVPSSKWCLCGMDFSANAIIDMAKDIVFLLSIYKWN